MNPTNRSLTVSVIIDPPAAMPCALESYCPQRGIVFEIAKIVCEKLNFDCIFIPANTTLYGYSENGTWMGVVGDVAAGRADTSLPRFTPTSQRAEVVDFTSSYFYEKMLLVTRRPDQSGHEKLKLINAFGVSVWICIAVVVLLAGLTMNHTILFKRSVSFIEHYVIKKMHADLLLTGKHGCIWTFSVAALILTRSYTGYLFSAHMAVESDRPFSDMASFSSCIQSKKCSLVLKSGTLSYVYQLLDTNKSETFSLLRTGLEANPMEALPLPDVLERILNDKTRFNTAIMWDTDFYYAANTDLKYDPCDFYYISAGLLPGPNTFPLPKNWTRKRELDKLGTEFNENGLIAEIMNRYRVQEIRQCKGQVAAQYDTLPFLIDLFIFLLAGEGVACLCLGIERIIPQRLPIRTVLPLSLPMTMPFRLIMRSDRDKAENYV